MGFLKNIKESINDKSSMNVNAITLLTSAFIGFVIGIVICFCLVYDVLTNGYIKTDLVDMGIFLLCSGGYIVGSGIPKTVLDNKLKGRMTMAEAEQEEDIEDMRAERRRKREELNHTEESEE